MKDRVKELRKSLGLSQTAFGARIGITKASVSQIENGVNSASTSTLKCIVKEFGVSENWLLTGNGSMYPDMSRSELAAKVVGKLLSDTDDEFVLNTFIALGQLSPQEWQLVKNFVHKIKG